jgi:hypothetical protein
VKDATAKGQQYADASGALPVRAGRNRLAVTVRIVRQLV